ncbi:hypothetical protein BJQ96_03511 [Flavobacterium sp. PL0002]|nr:hypothetical protein [Flavobacterium sp. PL002]
MYVFFPISSQGKPLERLADTTRISHDLQVITQTPTSRTYKNVATLDSVASYIYAEFHKNTNRVSEQKFIVENQEYKNVIASFGPENGERIIVGAHYDVCEEQQGADDNASGTAGLLELARLLKAAKLKYRVDLVAYTLEEPPFFRTDYMGSAVHAKSLYDHKIPVKGMICLETIGYFSEKENSQSYPIAALKWIYGDKGDYITLVQKFNNGGFPSDFKDSMFDSNSILTKSFKSPSFLTGVDFSDHLNYWKYGFSAVMITNTAFYRNPNYHTDKDVLETINIPKMALVIDSVFRAIVGLE